MAYGKRWNRWRNRRMPVRPKARRSRAVPTKTIKAIARSVVMKTAETKVSEYGQENVQLYHNVLHKVENNTLFTTQGVTDGDNPGVAEMRIGDMIYAKKLWFKFQLFNKQDRPNLHYRIMIVRSQTDRTGNAPTLPPDFVPESIPGNGNLLFTSSNDESYTIVWDRTYRLEATNSVESGVVAPSYHETSRIININYFIPKNQQKIIYHDGGSVPKKYVYIPYVVAYDSYGTLTTDNVASYAYTRKAYFKDV